MLVADICGSTRLYESVGDATAYRLVSSCISALGDNISKHDGRVVKTMGDGLLSTFPAADAAFGAAVAMQKHQTESDILIRIGMNYGSVVRKGRDVFGDCVNVAAHLLTLAKPSEIILTGEMVQNLPARLQSKTQLFDRASLKGKSAHTDFYRVTAGQQEKDITMISQDAAMQATKPQDLVLFYQGREIVIKEGVREFTIGRNPDCDLIAKGPYVSRSHATIKAQRGSFYLADHSANGTYVLYPDDDPIFLKREMLQLRNDGEISLSPISEPDHGELIRFRCGSHAHVGADSA